MTDRSTVELGEDVEDLRATLAEFASQLQDTTERLNALLSLQSNEAGESTEETSQKSKKQGESDLTAPPLILRLPPAEFDAELAALAQWVTYVLVPTYANEITSNLPWCAKWWAHPQAVARLHALWIAWQELTTPEAGGWTGPSVWHRDHLDPCLAALRSPEGPFKACMTTDSPQHHPLPSPPIAPL